MRLALVLLLVTLGGCSADFRWPAQCQEILKQLTDPAYQIKFSHTPAPAVQGQVWKLHWQDMALAIPAAELESLSIRLGEFGSYTLVLSSAARVTIVASVMEDNWFDDVFEATLGVPGPADDLNVAMHLSDVILRGYELDRGALGCRRGDLPWARLDAIALQMKSIGPGQPVAAYHQAGKFPGWTDVRMDQRYTTTTLHALPQARKGQIEQIAYRYPHDSPWAGLPMLLESAQDADEARNPPWLAALNAALSSGRADDWTTWAVAARRAQFDEEWIEGILEGVSLE